MVIIVTDVPVVPVVPVVHSFLKNVTNGQKIVAHRWRRNVRSIIVVAVAVTVAVIVGISFVLLAIEFFVEFMNVIHGIVYATSAKASCVARAVRATLKLLSVKYAWKRATTTP